MKGNEFEVCQIWELMRGFSLNLDERIENYTKF